MVFKHFQILVIVITSNFIYGQDFYIDNGFVRYLDGISSDWEDLNINEAYEFLSRSDFKNIKRSSMDDLEDKRLVLLTGYTYAGLRPKLEEMAQSVVEVETHDRAIGALKLKRGSYALLYETASSHSIALGEQLDYDSLIVSEVDLFFTLTKSVPNAEQFMQRLEAGFLAYQQSLILNKNETHP